MIGKSKIWFKETESGTKKIEMLPAGKAYLGGFRVIFNLREIRRGRRKGQFECFYFTGTGYRKVVVDKYTDFEGRVFCNVNQDEIKRGK